MVLVDSTNLHPGNGDPLSPLSGIPYAVQFQPGTFGKELRGRTLLRSEGRLRIKLLVSLQPGLHLRELQRQIGLSFSSTRYHVNKLAKEGEIDRVEDSGYSRIFPAGTDYNDKILLSFVRKKTDHRILSSLLTENHLSQQRLCDLTGLSKSTISEHIATLQELGIVRAKTGPERRSFELTDRTKINEMVNGNPVLLKKATHRFVDLWDF